MNNCDKNLGSHSHTSLCQRVWLVSRCWFYCCFFISALFVMFRRQEHSTLPCHVQKDTIFEVFLLTKIGKLSRRDAYVMLNHYKIYCSNIELMVCIICYSRLETSEEQVLIEVCADKHFTKYVNFKERLNNVIDYQTNISLPTVYKVGTRLLLHLNLIPLVSSEPI